MNEWQISGGLEEPARSVGVFDEPSEDHLRLDLGELLEILAFLQVGFQD